MNDDPWANFLIWEQASRDTIDFKTIYVDMADDLVAGLLLSQIVYWYLPSKKGQSKLRVFKDGYYWIAKARHEWWDEIRVKTRQIDRAIAILEEKGIIFSRLYRFNNAPTTHIRIIKEGFLAAWDNALARFNETVKSELPSDPFSPNRQFDLTDSSIGFNETVKSDLPESVQSLTETIIDPTETTTENTLLSSSKKPNDIVDQIIEQTKTHPSPEDLARKTLEKQAEAGGNYADPAHAGGDDLAASCAYTLFCEMQDEMPTTKERQNMILELSEVLRPLAASVDEIEAAFQIMVEDFQYRVGNYNIFQDSFKRDLATCIRRARAKITQRAAPRCQPESALLSQEALRERQAARPSPPQDDGIGIGIKLQLEVQMDRPIFRRYIQPTGFTCDDDILRVIAPDAFTRDWLENRLGVTVGRALAGVADGPREVVFEVKEVSL